MNSINFTKIRLDFRKHQSTVIQVWLLDTIFKNYDDKKAQELTVLYLVFAKKIDKIARDLLI